MFASFSDKPSEDKTLYLSTGSVIKFRKDPRYGRWSMKLDAGQLPKALRGTYMSFQDAFVRAEGTYRSRGVTLHKDKQERYSDVVNAVREEMGLERK